MCPKAEKAKLQRFPPWLSGCISPVLPALANLCRGQAARLLHFTENKTEEVRGVLITYLKMFN